MKELIQMAEELKKTIKRNEREIDNPVLVTSTLSNLDFFIENVEPETED